MVELYSETQPLSTSMSVIKYLWEPEKLFFLRETLRIGFGRRHVCASSTNIVIMECLQLSCSQKHVRKMVRHRVSVV